MAQPVVVRAYTSPSTTPASTSTNQTRNRKPRASLPAISSYAFADILKNIDSPELQAAINGIADIAANNRMALADEYGSHLPPLGEITATSAPPGRSAIVRPRALTTVEEASTSGSEGSGRRKSSKSIVGFWEGQNVDVLAVRRVRIGSMGRGVAVQRTVGTARPMDVEEVRPADERLVRLSPPAEAAQSTRSAAVSSLSHLLSSRRKRH